MSITTSPLSKRMQGAQSSAVRDLLKHTQTPGMISLAGGIPAQDLMDLDGLESATQLAMRSTQGAAYQYGLTEGEAPFRQAIVKLMQSRGVVVDPDQILVTTGSQQALDMVAKTFLDEGDTVLVEEPTYLAALQVFNMADARLVAAGTDDGRLDMRQLESLLQRERVKLIYLVPNFSNPAGATLQLDERRRLIDLAVRYQALIVEDDPYGELRYSGDDVPSLYKLANEEFDAADQVIYISSFSKILAPGLRLGWCIPPRTYLNPMGLAKQSLDLHSSTLSQYIATFYLQSGRLEDRIRVLREAYRSRRDALIGAIERYLPNVIEFNIPEGGMFLWGRLTNGLSAKTLLEYALGEKLMFVPGAYFFSGTPDESTLRLSFSMITSQTADEALVRLSRAVQKAERARTQSA